MLRALAVTALLCALSSSVGAKPLRVIVWPARPDTDTSDGVAAVTRAGHEVVPFATIRSRLAKRGTDAQAAETAVLEAVTAALEKARTAYVEQRFDDMAAELDKLETDSLAVLALPRHRATLWEVEFQRGLAELARSDRPAADRRFGLALALDPGRSPRKALYGPDVARAFAEVADAHTNAAARAVKIHVTPPDARVVVDGVAVVDLSRPRALRAGTHAVIVSAPGYEATAELVDIGATGDLSLALTAGSGDAVDRIGAAWALGDLGTQTVSGIDAIAAVVQQQGATAALVVDVGSDGSGVARLITPTESTPAIRRDSPAKAAEAAIARLLPSGSLGSGDATITGPTTKPRRSIFSKWWFWTIVGAAATTLTVVGFVVFSPDDKLQIVPPPAGQ